MAKKLYVRFSTPADTQAVFDFYAKTRHEFVFERDPEVWKERISSGAVTLVEDDAGQVVAAAIAYPLMKDGAHAWTEIGSVRVALEGIGLFDHLLAAHVTRAWLLEPPEDCFAIEIVRGNTHSRHVFVKAGGTPFDIPPELAAQVSATVTGGAQPVDWYSLGADTMPRFAQKVLDAAAGVQLVSKATQETFTLDYSRCVIVTHFHDALKKAAAAPPVPGARVGGFSRAFRP